MRRHHLPLLVIAALAVLEIGTGVLADVYAWQWVSDWLSPMLALLFMVTLIAYVSRSTRPALSREGWMRMWLRTAAVVAPIWIFLSIEIIGDAPVAMRLFGLSWTMGGYGASRLLVIGGAAIGAVTVGLSRLQARQEAAAAARATASGG